ncbi:phytanoyl-CoA dioxygenase family protein [Roseibacillus persicicus]|uniref:phytanoyl-CoA dioxygenase family protein n=1 Tax=Roseibacillus persicicus TaxID=454148 RepID=UPI00280D983E|nr:phytanoyl-CoA dioxygenase family protein [Roseibacillus persicicus]MDQ8190011.1 phytanoyl-CoA dioxygenase family protein [Roseibacillus persicicus]
MSSKLQKWGYETHRAIFDTGAIEHFRREADRVAQAAGSACVRHLRSRSEVFDELALSGSFLRLLPPGVSPVRSILFDKTPAENWPVPWHQDLTIAVVEERSVSGYGPWSFKDGSPHVQPPLSLLENMATIRLHLDETPAGNGALRVSPGSHRRGKLPSDLLRESFIEESQTCECQAGDVLMMSPLIIHSSRRSTAPNRRRVLHFEYARREDLDPELHWFE